MKYNKKAVLGSFVKTKMGMIQVNAFNKQLLFNLGHSELFENESSNKQIKPEQSSGNVKRAKKRKPTK